MNILKHLNILYIFKKSNSNSLQYVQSKCKNLTIEDDISKIKSILKTNAKDILFSEKDIPLSLLKEIRSEFKNTHIIVNKSIVTSEDNFYAHELKNIMYLNSIPEEKILLKNIFLDVIKNIDSNSSNIIPLKDNFIYDSYNNTLIKNNNFISLSKKEDMFLDYIIENKDRAVSYNELNDTLWEGEMTHNALRSVVKEVRRKTYKDLIKNISGVGYRVDI